jgi:hypothetical protein
MIRNPQTKRTLSIPLLVLGALLMLLAPENIWIGVLLFCVGAGVELAGLVLARRDKRRGERE